MKFIRFAETKNEQNLMTYEEDGNIYFSTLLPIEKDTEMKVWYCEEYGNRLGKQKLPWISVNPDEGTV